MAIDVKEQVIEKNHSSPFFAIQLDESTDIARCSQLMVFADMFIEILSRKSFFLSCIGGYDKSR